MINIVKLNQVINQASFLLANSMTWTFGLSLLFLRRLALSLDWEDAAHIDYRISKEQCPWHRQSIHCVSLQHRQWHLGRSQFSAERSQVICFSLCSKKKYLRFLWREWLRSSKFNRDDFWVFFGPEFFCLSLTTHRGASEHPHSTYGLFCCPDQRHRDCYLRWAIR